MIIVESAGLTDTGKKRKANEDTFFVDDELALYVVADGMGGHAAGEVASSLAAETIHNYMKNLAEKAAADDTPSSGGKSVSRQSQHLLAGIHLANQSVFQAAQAKTSYAGMGTTISAVRFCDNSFIAANVGDSPVFRIRNNTMELVSVLHTFASEVVADNPGVTEVDKSFYHILTQAVGVRESVRPDVVEKPCDVGDIIVICSDGLTDMVGADEIQSIASAQPAAEACRQLVDRANEAGGEDNITVIVLKITGIARDDESILGRVKGLLKKMMR